MPRPGTVSCLYIAVAEETKTTSQHWRSAWRPAIQRHSPCGKTGARAQEEGKGWGNGWSSGDHTPFTLHGVFLLAAARRRGCSVLWNPHWASSPGREWQKVNPRYLFVIIWAWSHAPLSQLGTLTQPPCRAGLQCFCISYICLENSLPSWWSFGTVVPYFFWKYESMKLTIDHCLGLHWWPSTSSFLFAEDMRRVDSETLKSEEDPCRAGLWLRLNLFSLLTVLLSSTLPSRACLFPFLYWPEGLILSYSAGYQHYDSMSSVYPSHFAQLPDEWDSL